MIPGFEYITSAMPGAYEKAYLESLADPGRFWARAAEDVEWMRRPGAVLDDRSSPLVRWFPGGVLNTCSNALDLHLATGRGEQAALVYDSPVTGTLRRFSYRELLDAVSCFAGALRSLGGIFARLLHFYGTIFDPTVTGVAVSCNGRLGEPATRGRSARAVD